MKTTDNWNPRYVAYAKANGRTPRDQAACDEDDYPGGRMTGFVLWLRPQWVEFQTMHGCNSSSEVRLKLGMKTDFMFDEWLEDKVNENEIP